MVFGPSATHLVRMVSGLVTTSVGLRLVIAGQLVLFWSVVAVGGQIGKKKGRGGELQAKGRGNKACLASTLLTSRPAVCRLFLRQPVRFCFWMVHGVRFRPCPMEQRDSVSSGQATVTVAAIWSVQRKG